MRWIRIKGYLLILLINMVILFLILGILEFIFMLNFDEFKGHIHSPQKTLGKNVTSSDFYGHRIRSSNSVKEQIHNSNKELVIILGDSISGGYGHGYHDIWMNKLDRLLQIKEKAYDFKAIPGFGNNFLNSISDGTDLIIKLEQDGKKPYKVIYQFNFNDIHLYTKQQLNSSRSELFENFSFAKWRYEYLNKSVFARVMQFYAGILRRDTSGTCEERSFDALSQYTWTFGSKIVSLESLEMWKKFGASIYEFKKFLSEKDIQFEILISPIIFQIDQIGRHPHYNHLKLDFNCATINPIKRLKEISMKNNIKVYDPISYVRSMFIKRIEDNNFERFFFAGDSNHLTPIASSHVAEFIAKEWIDNRP